MGSPSNTESVTLEREACFTFLGQVSTGRVGISIDALPVVLPLQFVLSEKALWVQTVRGTKLDAALRGAVVAFQADAGDPTTGTHWSVLVQGMATEIDEPPGRRRAQRLDGPWTAPHEGLRRIRIEATVVSGRLFRVGPGSARKLPTARPSVSGTRVRAAARI